MSKEYSQCQSCGMPLKKGSGTEADGSPSKMYCHYCYQNGKFTQPDITMEEMKVISDNALKEAGWIWPMRWMAKMQIPTLQRWKK